MQRSTRFNRPGLKGGSTGAVLLTSGEQFILKAAPDTTTSTALTWNAAVPKPNDYRVERSLDGSTFSTVTTLANTVFDYNDTGLTESTQYWYRIVPILGGVDQPASNVADTWTVPATPTSLTATAISSTQINLAWTDVSTGNTAQSIQRRSPAGSGSYSFIASVGATANSYSDTGLTLATQYEYQVAATNPATQSAWSTAANATTTGGGPPSASWTLDFSTGEPWANGTNYVFSSTASTTRTFVNSSGYVAPCVANLCLQSEDFTTTWTNTNTTETGDAATAPDNNLTADELIESAGTTVNRFISSNNISFTSGVTYTASVYAKANSATCLQIFFGGAAFGTGAWATFNVSAGTVGSVGATVTTADRSITDAGNGWYRCTLTQTTTGTSNQTLSLCLTNNTATTTRAPTYTVTAGNERGLYLWGAQLVTGSAPLPYSATTTSSNGIPRLTHNSSGSRLGLLVEGQRANLLLHSRTNNDTSWSMNGSTKPSTTETAPNNAAEAVVLRDSTANTYHFFLQDGVAVSASTQYVYSCYFKANALSHACISMVNSTNATGIGVVFSLSGSGSVTQTNLVGSPLNTSSGIENVGNGWYRCWVSQQTLSSGFTSARCFVCSSNSGTPASVGIGMPIYAGSTQDAINVWGAQLETGSVPSTIIPTTTASVTRSADLAYVETADVTNWGRPGSFVVEYYEPLEQSGGVVVADDDGAGNAGRLGVEYSAGGPRIVYGTSGSGSGGTDTAGLNKVGWAWNGSGAATRSALNGSALDTSLATSFDPTLTDGINLGGNIDWSTLPLTVSGQPNVVIRRVRFWNSQLSAADLNTLTT